MSGVLRADSEIPEATINGNRTTYTIADNGPLDEDDIPGQIADPVTSLEPFRDSPTAVPMLPTFSLIPLTTLLALLGSARLRQRAQPSNL